MNTDQNSSLPPRPPRSLTINTAANATGHPNIPDARERQLLREKELAGSAEKPEREERVPLRSDDSAVVVVVVGIAAAAATAAVAAVGFSDVPTRCSGGAGPNIPREGMRAIDHHFALRC